MRSRLKLGLCACLVLAGCAGSQQTTPAGTPQQPALTPEAMPGALGPETPPPKVGLLLPLSGSAGDLGQDLLDAAQLALFEVRESNLELLPRDTGDTPAQAVAAARSALDAGAEVLIGPLFGRSTTAVAPLAAERGVPVLSFSNDAGVAGGGVYVLGFRPEEQIERVVSYAAGQGIVRFAVLAPDDAYGTRGIDAWRQAVARQPGGDAAVAATYPAEAVAEETLAAVREVAAYGRPGGVVATDPLSESALAGLAEPAAELPPPGVDSVLIADGGARVGAMAGALARYGVAPPETRLLGTMRWEDDPALLADPQVRGAWLATWPPGAMASFARKFETIYGRPPTPLAVLAYDATALAVLLGQGEPRFTPEQITDAVGFAGGAGIFRLRPDGLTEHGLAVVQLERTGVQVIDPAPELFPGGIAHR